MCKHILIPTDGSELSEMAVRQGMAFAKQVRKSKAPVMLMTPGHPM